MEQEVVSLLNHTKMILQSILDAQGIMLEWCANLVLPYIRCVAPYRVQDICTQTNLCLTEWSPSPNLPILPLEPIRWVSIQHLTMKWMDAKWIISRVGTELAKLSMAQQCLVDAYLNVFQGCQA
jgi:hypothetical protein